MKNIKTLFLHLLLPLVINAQSETDPLITEIGTQITRILEEWNVPGCAVTIIEKNKILFTGGFGYTDLKSKKLVDENTVFPIASCTKAFTATLIGIIADEGEIDIDKPANDYLPILKFSDRFSHLT